MSWTTSCTSVLREPCQSASTISANSVSRKFEPITYPFIIPTHNAHRAWAPSITPGGTHADGHTANALVVFPDGTYLELLHFTIAPPPDSSNPWAHKQPGWIDFAFLGNDGTPSVAATINSRAAADGSGARYAPEARGGRTREDGRVLEWLISAPDGDGARGQLPFFCGDLTPRGWRVSDASSGCAARAAG